jgi:hypothetical protein
MSQRLLKLHHITLALAALVWLRSFALAPAVHARTPTNDPPQCGSTTPCFFRTGKD